jgi:hypothetical protein
MSAAVAIARLILSGGESPLGVLLLAEVYQELLPPGARAPRCPKDRPCSVRLLTNKLARS